MGTLLTRRRSLRLTAAAAVAAIAVVAGAPGTGAAAAPVPACGWLASQTPAIDHVIEIVMENHGYDQVIGPATYLTGLARRCGLATNSWAVSHPSLPNYMALTSGTTFGLRIDCEPGSCSRWSPNIFSQLRAARRPWRAFNESMPAACWLSSTSLYAARHNPAVYYLNLRPSCRRNDVPLGSPSRGPLAHALAAGLPDLTMVTPNVCSDMHSCPVSVGDRWLHSWMSAIIHSPAYRRGHTAVFITFDEGAGINHVATVVVSPYTPAGTTSSVRYTHYSLLRTEQTLLHLRYLGGARTARGLVPAFHL
ncbi:MAG: alkaline phosphatase family protein [Gaiellales bacterium]